MNYKETRKTYMEKQAEMFAEMMYLNQNYNNNFDIEKLLDGLLYKGWFIKDEEKEEILEKAIKIFNEKNNKI